MGGAGEGGVRWGGRWRRDLEDHFGDGIHAALGLGARQRRKRIQQIDSQLQLQMRQRRARRQVDWGGSAGVRRCQAGGPLLPGPLNEVAHCRHTTAGAMLITPATSRASTEEPPAMPGGGPWTLWDLHIEA